MYTHYQHDHHSVVVGDDYYVFVIKKQIKLEIKKNISFVPSKARRGKKLNKKNPRRSKLQSLLISVMNETSQGSWLADNFLIANHSNYTLREKEGD